MKRLMAFAGALLLFCLTWVIINEYHKNILAGKKQELTYYNTDSRNSDIAALELLLAEGAIPVLGSSELSAADDVAYPPALFHMGNSDFNMILMGRGYMQSLHQAVTVGAISDILPDKKVVLILSPQWFTVGHLNSETYASRFQERLYVEFLKNPSISHATKASVTERLKSLLTADEAQLERVENYEAIYLKHSLNPITRVQMGVYDAFMELRQNYLLAQEIKERQNTGTEPVQAADLDFEALREAAKTAGEAACTNNDLYIYDEYYDTYVRDSKEAYRNSMSDLSYLESPEYDDLRLFLTICQETGIEPLIVSIPVNGRWYDWCGFLREEREAYYQKIRDICAEYQVALADFSEKEYEEYFLKDSMHLGWKGWVYLDEAVYQFYQEDGNP